MAETGIWAVVPIKETFDAKQRLADFVPAHLRPGFTLAMFEDVLDALVAATGLAGIVVVTADDAAAEIAGRMKSRGRYFLLLPRAVAEARAPTE